MSWGLYIEVPDKDLHDPYVHIVSGCTYNLTPMWAKAIPFLQVTQDFDGLEARHVLPDLLVGMSDIIQNMDAYKALNPDNGWGDFDGFFTVYTSVLKTCAEYPGGILRWNG